MGKSRGCFFQQVLCAAMVLAIPGYCSASSVFNFDSIALGTDTPFSDTNNGITATFSSAGDPGGFAIGGSFFRTLLENVLIEPGSSNAGPVPLTVTFSRNLTSVSLLFATSAKTTFFLDAYNSGSIVGGASSVGTVPEGFRFPEGTISFGNIPSVTFNQIVLTSDFYFAIDDLTVTTVPEPSTLLMLGTGLLGGIGVIRRKLR